MTAKEYLWQIRLNDAKINRLIRSCDEMRSSIVFISGIDYAKDRVQSGADGTPGVNKSIEKLYDMERKLTRMIDKYIDDKARIVGQINELGMEPGKDIYSELLYLRYVNFMSLEEISVRLKYSYPHTKRIHGYALQAFGKKFLKDDT